MLFNGVLCVSASAQRRVKKLREERVTPEQTAKAELRLLLNKVAKIDENEHLLVSICNVYVIFF